MQPQPDATGAADWELRWFTPTVEIRLCGHATLASGHVLLTRDPARDRVTFRTRKAGVLEVRRVNLIQSKVDEPFARVTVWCAEQLGRQLSLDDVEVAPRGHVDARRALAAGSRRRALGAVEPANGC